MRYFGDDHSEGELRTGKAAIAVLLMIIIAFFMQSAWGYGGFSFSHTGAGGPSGTLSSVGADARKIEERMALALEGIGSKKGGCDLSSANASTNALTNASKNESTNESKNWTGQPNVTQPDATGTTEAGQTGPGFDGPGSQPSDSGTSAPTNSSGAEGFGGFYGVTASRHEIGQGGIDSRMFLSGSFETEKRVSFQDRDFG